MCRLHAPSVCFVGFYYFDFVNDFCMVYCCSSSAWQLLVILLLVCLLVCLYVCVCVCVDGVATLTKLVRCFAMLLSLSLIIQLLSVA